MCIAGNYSVPEKLCQNTLPLEAAGKMYVCDSFSDAVGSSVSIAVMNSTLRNTTKWQWANVR